MFRYTSLFKWSVYSGYDARIMQMHRRTLTWPGKKISCSFLYKTHVWDLASFRSFCIPLRLPVSCFPSPIEPHYPTVSYFPLVHGFASLSSNVLHPSSLIFTRFPSRVSLPRHFLPPCLPASLSFPASLPSCLPASLPPRLPVSLLPCLPFTLGIRNLFIPYLGSTSQLGSLRCKFEQVHFSISFLSRR